MLICPSCGKENPDGFRFCGFCAAALADEQRPSTEERKIVTVLFCDLVGFTASSDAADPEDVRAKIRPYHRMLRTEIEAYGGTVEKFIGDAVMAVFGAPLAHEDDAERAVRAGLRIIEAIEELNEDDPSLELTVRVGIDTGEAVVALGARPEQGEGIVTGDVVNTASRLQGAAPIGGVGVGEGTYRATDRIFEYEDLDAVMLKGKAEPVAIWWAKEARSRFGVDVARSYSTPFIGRELERDLLIGTFERSVRDANAQLVTVVGEPGVGKTRLVDELLAYIDERPGELITWRQGRCLPYGDGITFWALGEIVKAHAGILETDGAEEAIAKLDATVGADDPDASWLRMRLRPLVGVEAPPAEREENFTAWRRFLESLAEHVPTVLVFEDLHWADDALLAFLEHVTDYAEGVPLLLVGTGRPELFERAPSWGGGKRNAATINLTSLSDDETSKLVANLLEQTLLPAEVQSAIVERSGGNPLYAEEFVRLLRDQGVLRKEGATWTLDPGADIPMPSGVQGLIAARLDTLSPDRKELLQDAAVIGKVFWAGAVAAMGNRDPAEVTEALHELSRKELVRPARRSSMEGESEYAFWHAFVRDVAYRQIPRAARAGKHVAVAGWIEDMAGERIEDHAEILAAHYAIALELAKAVKGVDTKALEAKALRFLLLAGDRALGVDAEAAERHYARAVESASVDSAERYVALARHADALLQRGRFEQSSSVFEEAIAGLQRKGEVSAAAVAMSAYTSVLFALGDSRFLQLADDAVALLEPRGPTPELIRALSTKANARIASTDRRGAILAAEHAIRIAEELGLPMPARALGARGAARCIEAAGGLDDQRDAVEVAIAQGLGRETALLRNNLAASLDLIEGPREAIEVLRVGLDDARRRGIEEFDLSFRQALIGCLADLGQWDAVAAQAVELAPALEETGFTSDLLALREVQCLVLTRRGDLAAAEPLADWIVPKARELGTVQFIASSLTAAGAFHVRRGNQKEALALLREVEATEHIRESENFQLNLFEIVDLAIAAGDVALASRFAEGTAPDYPPRARWAHVSAKARLLLESGEQADAAILFDESALEWRHLEMPWERAKCLASLGRCLVELGRAADAKVPLSEAGRIFSSLGAGPALESAEALLERATALT